MNIYLSCQLMRRANATNASNVQSTSSQRNTCRSTMWSLIHRSISMLNSKTSLISTLPPALTSWRPLLLKHPSNHRPSIMRSKSQQTKNFTPKSSKKWDNNSVTICRESIRRSTLKWLLPTLTPSSVDIVSDSIATWRVRVWLSSWQMVFYCGNYW